MIIKSEQAYDKCHFIPKFEYKPRTDFYKGLSLDQYLTLSSLGHFTDAFQQRKGLSKENNWNIRILIDTSNLSIIDLNCS